MSCKPLVSCIIAFLNREKFLQAAIESVFAQTYDNWELLLVDDGSTDRSTAIALEYAAKYPDRVRYLDHDGHQNRGASATRNLGIKQAKGDYVAFLDSDDVWLPHKLEQQVAILEAQPETGMVYGSTQYWYSWTGNPEDFKRDSHRKVGIPANTLMHPPTLLTLILQDEFKTPTPGICSVLIRRQVIETVGGFEDNFRGMYDDQAFFLKVFLKAPVFVLGEVCDSKYRQHPEQQCSVAMTNGYWHNSRPSPARLTFLIWLSDYLSAQRVQNPEIWRAIQNALWGYNHPFLYSLVALYQNWVQWTQDGLNRIRWRTMAIHHWFQTRSQHS